MKKPLVFMLVIILSVSLMSGCGGISSGVSSSTGEEAAGAPPDLDAAEDVSEVLDDASRATASESVAQEGGVTDNSDVPAVYMTAEISPEGLMAVYEALDTEITGNVAVKVHTGEPGGQNFLRPEFMRELVQAVNGTIVESNTAYGGQRASTDMHYQVAEDHGFTAIAPFVVLDETASMALPIRNATHFDENLVGARLADFDYLVTLSHFKGHAMGGYGGALKNMSIGIASAEGKNLIHTAGESNTSIMGGEQDYFLESMAEATLSVVDYFEGNVLYINVMNRMSVDCDCSGASAAEPEVHDIGILASYDPVALDQACIDLIYKVEDGTADSLIERIESRNGIHTIEHAEAIGLGSREYQLVNMDA